MTFKIEFSVLMRLLIGATFIRRNKVAPILLSNEKILRIQSNLDKTRIKKTFGYKKRFHSSDFMLDKLSTLQWKPLTWDKRIGDNA